ncbi:MAG: hypothetical protein WAO35_10445 [Terriglobia bacterium]
MGKRAHGREVAGVVKRLPRARPGVFLNIPYDPAFRELHLAYIAGACSFNLVPRATLEIPGGEQG